MTFDQFHRVYLVGIGGIGMSGLARYFKHCGKQVSGYDKTATELTALLVGEGIDVAFQPDLDKVGEYLPIDTLVIYTPAVPSDHPELVNFNQRGFTVLKRAQALGFITQNKYTLAVAGTHGKTTTSAMLAHILTQSGKGASAFLGGVSTNYNTNVLLSSSENVIVEADEYDRSFLQLKPNTAIVTSMEADHLDIYGDVSELQRSFQQFMQLVPPDGHLVIHHDVAAPGGKLVHTYGLRSGCDLWAENIRIEEGFYVFDMRGAVNEGGVVLGMPGIHNVENAVGATMASLLMGIDLPSIKSALRTFLGVKRRFEYCIRRENLVYIDDYAHHPTELEQCIQSVRMLYPDKRITGVFQPHLYTRTRDFVDGFAESLAMLNDLVLLDIYPAREEPIDGVTSQWLLDKVQMQNKQLCSKDEAVNRILEMQPEVLLTLGAGDIDELVDPLKRALN